ncbi:MAG TPA: hypothetical protein VFF40_14050 [Acidimicrobiia bacterium]|nr:hypothetical protein [Acidimicrobiia bacterium]
MRRGLVVLVAMVVTVAGAPDVAAGRTAESLDGAEFADLSTRRV